MAPTDDEFRFLPADAREAGWEGPLPPVERVALTLEDGRALSALRFGDSGGVEAVMGHCGWPPAHQMDARP